VTLPFEEVFPKLAVCAIFLKIEIRKDSLKGFFLCGGGLSILLGLLRLHFLNESLKNFGVLFGEVILLLALLLVTHVVRDGVECEHGLLDNASASEAR